MIPTKTDVNITGTLPGEDVQMTLDSNSLAHLMSVLSNLYSNKTLAIVREYSTNALDSHIEAGVSRPIEVSTPTDFMPFFKVRDFGVGMDADTIRNVYSRYGASTKRSTNTQNGMLGLGSKSALTYTTQFNITGVKDGIKTYVVVSRTVEGSGVMKIISQSVTDEPNGVEISIPTSNKREIEVTAHNFFKFWKPGTVLLNGKDPSNIDGLKLGKFTVTTSISRGTDYVVMGNVAYPIPEQDRIFADNWSRSSVVAYVEMGEVNFTPSREALHMTTLTKNTLQKLKQEFEIEIKKHIETKVEKAATHSEAIRSYCEIIDSDLGTYSHNIKYKGVSIPKSMRFDWCYSVVNGNTYSANHVNAQNIFGKNAGKYVIVYGYDKEKVHSTHRSKVKLWLENEDIEAQFVCWAGDISDNPWIEDVTKVHWDDVRKMKLVRTASTGVKQVLFDNIDSRGYRVHNRTVDTAKAIVYASPSEVASQEKKDLVAKFLTCDANIQFVLVNKNKWKSFKEDYPAAIHVDKKVAEEIDSYLKNLTPEEKIYLRSSWKDRIFCGRLDETKVLDPTIKTAIKTLSTKGLSSQTEQKYEKMSQIARHWGISFPDLLGGGEKLFKQYPLLNVYGHSAMDLPLNHIYLYLNACYTQNLTIN